MLVVTGLPATGKSTLAQHLHTHLRWPLLTKDAFKERLYDVLGAPDLEASRRLSLASYATMFEVAQQLTAARIDCILEGNFRWSQTQLSFQSLRDVRFTQVWCSAPRAVIEQRLRARASGQSRHPAHPDAANFESLLRELDHPAAALPLPGALVTVNTAEPMSLERVIAEVLRAID